MTEVMFTVGQTVWFVPARRNALGDAREGRELRVTHVGRKWASLETIPTQPGHISYEFGRCDKATGCIDGKGYSSPGRCWASQAEWQTWAARHNAWQSLRTELQRLWGPVPDGVTLEDMAKVRELLKL